MGGRGSGCGGVLADRIPDLEEGVDKDDSQWQDLGVLDEDQRVTRRGAWGLPRALHRTWSH